MNLKTQTLQLLATSFLLASCAPHPSATTGSPGLTGAWRSKIQFTSGGYSSIKDLDFLYVFNAGRTMTESSNYDAAPPMPPACGVWRKIGPHEFEAKYVF